MLWPSTTIKPHARPWICSKSSTSTPTTTNMAVIASLSRKTGSGLRTTNQGQTLPDHSDGNPTTGIMEVVSAIASVRIDDLVDEYVQQFFETRPHTSVARDVVERGEGFHQAEMPVVGFPSE